MAEVTVTERTREQGRRLRALREHLGISKPRLMDALGFGSSQSYDLYERGVSVIRLDRVPDWADAFGLPSATFLAVVMGELPVEDLTWSFREALRGQIPEDQIEELAREHEGAEIPDQRAAADSILRQASKRRTAVTRPPRRRNRPA